MREIPKHKCHAPDCPVQVPPAMFACTHHWRILPKPLKNDIWANYVSGQEARKDPTPEYLRAAHAAVNWYLENDK
jgi:hypothetical protein